MATFPYRPAEFVHDVAALYDPSQPKTIWGCDLHVKRLLGGDLLQFWINQQLKALLGNPIFDGDWAAKEVTLHRGNGWTLSLALLDSPRRYVHLLPTLSLYAPLGGASLIVERYSVSNGYRNDVFDPSVRLEALGPITVPYGDVLHMDTEHIAYYLQVPRPLAVLRLETSPVRPLEWLFSRQTLQAWQANDADLSYTQLRVAAYVLGKIAHQSSIAPLRELAQHPHHAVRWAAIQNLGRLNRSEALVKIREAVNDPHPHVRRAAQKTLDRLEGKAVT
jgi:hypothetical protein